MVDRSLVEVSNAQYCFRKLLKWANADFSCFLFAICWFSLARIGFRLTGGVVAGSKRGSPVAPSSSGERGICVTCCSCSLDVSAFSCSTSSSISSRAKVGSSDVSVMVVLFLGVCLPMITTGSLLAFSLEFNGSI